jgi:biopolymer transport protein ExbD
MVIKQPQDEGTKFNMAPMIDMVFLLLVFFMCASKISRSQKMEMTIPEANKAVVPEDRPDRWTVNVMENGDVFSGDALVQVEDLAEDVKARLQQQPELSVYIRADANAEHKEVKKVMDALAGIGMDDFIFGVYKPQR